MNKLSNIKCNQTSCLNHDSSYCDLFIPSLMVKLKPNDRSCIYFENLEMNKKLKEQLKNNSKVKYDDAFSEADIERLEKAKKAAKATAKRKAKEAE